MVEISLDAFLGGGIQILQPKVGHHRAGLDAVLLAACVPARTSGLVADLGAGVGTVGLCLAQRMPYLNVTLIEREAELIALARRNAEPFAGRVDCCQVDLLLPAKEREAAGLLPASMDVIIANPPFHPLGRIRPSPEAGKADAYMLRDGEHLGWVKAAAHLGRGKAQLLMILRADDLTAWLNALHGRFGGVQIVPLHTKDGKAASRVLLRAIKGSNAPLQLWGGITLHSETGDYHGSVQAALNGAALPIFE